jgi:hypothetical protein
LVFEMSKFRILFQSVHARTSMYIRDATYGAVVAFVVGYDVASEGGVLIGFREWLIPRVGAGNNLTWQMLVLQLAFPNAVDPSAAASANTEAEKHAINVLFELIAEFDDSRQAPDGLRTVYLDYERWLRTQDWYVPGSPGWVDGS